MKKLALLVLPLFLLGIGTALAADPAEAPASQTLVAQMPVAAPPPMALPALDWSGFYVGVDGGYGWNQSNGNSYCVTPAGVANGVGCDAPNGNAVSPSGGLFGGEAGYNIQNGMFVYGVETDMQWSGIKGSDTHGVLCCNPAPVPIGTISESSNLQWFGTVRGRLGYLAMPNLLVFGTAGAIVGRDSVSATTLNGFVYPASASSTRLGATIGGGVEYAYNPNISVKLEGLYYDMGQQNASFTCPPGGTTCGPGFSTPAAFAVRGEMIRVGLNWHFGAPSPAPPAPEAMAAPPPTAAKVFIVFFDWDKDLITPEGQAIIQQAADAYKAGAPVQIQVTGYTDRSGSPGYNQRLSERRANNVAKAMAALGVPRNQMAVSGRGENDNRVPTAPGVREPQNRRVEILEP